VSVVTADFESQAQIRAAAEQIKSAHREVHVLVNNAGIWLANREETEDGIEKTLAVNYLGQFLLTNLLLDELERGAPSRVIGVSAAGGWLLRLVAPRFDFDDLMLERKYASTKAVPRSKMAVILFTQELAERLRGTGVTANALSPGIANTKALDEALEGMPRLARRVLRTVATTPRQASQTVVYLAMATEVTDVSGKFFTKCKQVLPPRTARDPVAQKRLWGVSAQLVGLGEPTTTPTSPVSVRPVPAAGTA
jgi:NAD(P)-dependent dehydrogenase (short-subunit alcohol dehydrogenase family)